MPTDSQSLPHILIAGNPVDGFEYYGAFLNARDAAAFGNTNGDIPDEWWIAPLHFPEDWAGTEE